MGERVATLDFATLLRKSTLAPIEIPFPCQRDDGIALATGLGTVGTVQSIAVNGVWVTSGGRLPVCMQPVAITSVATDTYTYRIVGEDWFGDPVDTGFVLKNATNVAGRSITQCFSRITLIEVNPVVVTNVGVDAISFGWRAGVATDNCAFPIPIRKGYTTSGDVPTTIPCIHMLDNGGGEFDVYGGGGAGVPGLPGFAGPTAGVVTVNLNTNSFLTRMTVNTAQPIRFGKLGINLSQAAILARY